MDPISNVDQLVLMLRQRLMERSKGVGGKDRSTRASTTPSPAATPLSALGALDDRQFRRALIQDILGERMGRQLVNDAEFQQVVERVATALEQDATAGRLMDRVVRELRGAAT